MTAIISMLSGGSVVQTQALRVQDGGKVVRIRAVPGGQYVVAREDGGAVAGLLAKRCGKSLLLAHEVDGVEQESLVIDDFYGNHARLFGVGADGRYQPYVSVAELDMVEASDVASGTPVPLQLSAASSVDGTFALSEIASAEPPRALRAPGSFQEAETVASVTDGQRVENSAQVNLPGLLSQVVEVQGDDALSTDLLVEFVPQVVDATADTPLRAGDVHVDAAISQTEPVIEYARDDVEVVGAGIPVAAAGSSTPAIDALIDDHGVIQGNVENGGVTDDGRPELIGTAESGVLVHVYDGKYLIGNTTANGAGKWSFVPSVPLADGRHSITVVYQYPNGDVSDNSAPYVVIVDKVVPPIPVVNDMLDDQGRIQGQIGNGSVTDDNRPTVSGLAEPLSTLIIYDKGKEIDRVPVGEDGKWIYIPTTALVDGLHILAFAAVDRAGNMGERSSTTEFLVDTRAELVSIFAAEDRAGEVKGNFASGGVTDDMYPRLFGSATAGGTVTIYEGSVLLGKVVAGVDGNWEFTPVDALGEGVHSLTATVTTDAKGESDRSASFDFTVDVTAPDSPVIERVYDDNGALQGTLVNGQSTDDTTPTLSGTAEAGSTVRIYDKGILLGSTVASPAGKWSFVPSPALVDGDHLFAVTAQDKAGNVSLPSDTFAIIVDTVPPAAPTIESVYDDQGGRTGLLNPGDITDDAKPTISGTAEANATVVIRDHGLEIGRAVANAEGEWTFEPFLPMGLGAHKLTAEAIDAAGNVSGLSNAFELALGSPEPPAIPAITSVIDDAGSVTGSLQKNDVTDDPRPTINGTAQPG
ncbi:MAG: Ig-like domain-containing protein, partial [Stenotrophomonas sp.]